MKAIRNIQYEKGRKDVTNEDRWNIYLNKVYKVLDRIPPAQKSNRVFQETLSKHFRTVIKPNDLREYVKKAYSTGVHPGSREYNPVWQQETRYSVAKTETMIESVIEYLDTRAKEGLWELKWDEPAKVSQQQEVCNNWLLGKCKRGDKCTRKHIPRGNNTIPPAQVNALTPVNTPPKNRSKPEHPTKTTPTDDPSAEGNAGENTNASAHGMSTPTERPIGPDNKRCIKDEKGEKCTYGRNCYFAHRNPINPRKDAAPRTPPREHPDKTCRACGETGHIAHQCKKLKAHSDEVKQATGWEGDFEWFKDKNNSAKCIALFQMHPQWFAAAVHNLITPNAHITTALPEGRLPYMIGKKHPTKL